jgi:hypothetical protein
MAHLDQCQHLEGRRQKIQRRGGRGCPALLQHAGQHERRGYRVRVRHGQGTGREGHHDEHNPDHGEAHRAGGGQAQADGGLSRPRRHQRPQPDFTAAGYDAIAFIKQHHDKITNLHIKDRKKDHGPNVAVWGTGDTPIKAVLQLLKTEKYPFPANLELEYPIPEGSNIIAEAKKCLAYVKSCLA